MSWQERMEHLLNEDVMPPQDHGDFLYDDSALLGRRGPHGVSSVAIRENGLVEAFAGPNTGIRIDPEKRIVTIYGSRINIVGEQVDVFSNPQRFRWNRIPLHLTPSLLGTVITPGPWAGQQVMIQPGTLLGEEFLRDAVSGMFNVDLDGWSESTLQWLSG